MRSRWKRIRYRLEWIGLILATKLIPLLSRRACYYLAQTAEALMPRTDPAGAWHHPSLQSTAAKGTDGVAGRSYRAARSRRGSHRLLRAEDERDFSACVAA